MTEEKLLSELQTLKKFTTLYCNNKHSHQQKYSIDVEYKSLHQTLELELCQECQSLLGYSIKRLLECPHEVKPRCRKCPNPCYERPQWKRLGKLMRYSSVAFEVQKIKNFFVMK